MIKNENTTNKKCGIIGNIMLLFYVLGSIMTFYYHYRATIDLKKEIEKTTIFYPVIKGLIGFVSETTTGVPNNNFVRCILYDTTTINQNQQDTLKQQSQVPFYIYFELLGDTIYSKKNDNNFSLIQNIYKYVNCVKNMLNDNNDLEKFLSRDNIKQNPEFYKRVFGRVITLRSYTDDVIGENIEQENQNNDKQLLLLEDNNYNNKLINQNANQINTNTQNIYNIIFKSIELFYFTQPTKIAIEMHKLQSINNHITFFKTELLNDMSLVATTTVTYGRQTLLCYYTAICIGCLLISHTALLLLKPSHNGGKNEPEHKKIKDLYKRYKLKQNK